MSDGPRVAVVGAGLSGLAAAVKLARRGAQVDIYERSRLVGGKATSFTVDGVEVDNGQHVILGCCSDFLDFVADLDMTDTLHMQPRFQVTVLAANGAVARLRAAPLPAPLHLMLGFARYAHLGVRDRARVARALIAARRPVRSAQSMAGWLSRHGQNAATRRAFWDPFLVPALNARLDDVSATDGLFVIRTAFLGHRDAARIGYSTVPLARLAERAAQRAGAVHLRTSVAAVRVEGERVTGLQLDDGRTVACDACVIAVPPRRLQSILGDAETFGIRALERFQTEPIVDVHLWYDRTLAGIDFVALLDSPVQWVFAKGPGYLCCSLSAAGDLVSRPERELVELCDRHLRNALRGLRGAALVRGAATRDPEATFVPAPGLQRPGPRTALANLAIAGAWTDTGWPATMESAVRSGRAAAACLVDGLRRSPGSALQAQPREAVGAV